ncbi:hypothetical protein CEV34_1422 [Brucella pseudogrignonensis]|uniref:Uncharacterized protein n=1 Tax=Brucella pseudogrignonensis TaxID=419475 RepID=A0A256GKT0_9HYPH|nr:hypothetical protein CEV34_1422 [Brucella pseudogrignonensis]
MKMKVRKRSGHSFLPSLLTTVRKMEAPSTSHGRRWETWQVIHSEPTCVKLSKAIVDKTRNIWKTLRYTQPIHKLCKAAAIGNSLYSMKDLSFHCFCPDYR